VKQSDSRSRAAVLRRSEGTRFSSTSEDEVGGLPSAIRARDVRAADLQEEPTKRAKNSADSPTQSFRWIRRRRRLLSEHRSERSEPSDTASVASEAVEHRIAGRRAEEKRGDTLFVHERRRSRRTPERDPREASVASEAVKRSRLTR
jgi:hypothetical protein